MPQCTCVTFSANFACNRSGGQIKCRVEWIGVSDWFVITVTANSCTKSCGVPISWFSESALPNESFCLSVSENVFSFSMYLNNVM